MARGAEVVALVRPTSDTWRIDGVPDVQIVRSAEWEAEIGRLGASAVLSLDWAGVPAVDRNNDEVQARNVVRQTGIIEAAIAAGVKTFVGVGSQMEYGPVDDQVAEDRDPTPVTAYGRAKVAARIALLDAMEPAGARWVWARIFSVFGPLETGGWLLPSIARSVADGVALPLSSGMQRWSYLYAADAGTALAELALNPAAQGTYNVGHPDAPPLRQSVITFADALEGETTLAFGEKSGPHAQPDMTRLTALGWAPANDTAEALAKTARWLQGATIADPLVAGFDLPTVR